MQNLDKTTFTRRSLILPIYLPAFLLSFGNGIVVPTLPLYAKSFDLPLSLVGLVVAMQGIGVLIADVPSGIMLGRVGQKPSMVIGTAVLALSTLGVGLAHTLFELIVCQFVAGTGGAMWGISRHAYMADVIPVHERGRSIALFGGLNRVGTFAGPIVGGYLGAHYGLRVPFFVYATVTLMTSLLFLIFMAEPKPVVTKSYVGVIDELSLYLRDFIGMLRTHYRSFATAGSAQICAQALRAGRRIIIPLYGSEVIGLNVQAVGLIFSISSFVDMSMFPVAGFIMDRLGRRYAVIPCFFIFATGMVMIPFTRGFGSLLIATIIMGFGNGIGSGTMMTLGADLAPRDETGAFLGVWRLIGDVGGMTGPLVVGNIAQIWELTVAAFVLGGIGYTAVLIFLLFVPETLRTKKMRK